MSTTHLALAGNGMDAPAVVLKIGGLGLLFRQSEIRALELAADVDCNSPVKGSVGWISYLRQRWPVYCPSEQLGLLDPVPPSRRTCALLAAESGFIGILCDDASILKQVTGKRHEVPPAMQSVDTPILELITTGNNLLCVTHPGRLSDHMMRQTPKAALPEELPCPA